MKIFVSTPVEFDESHSGAAVESATSFRGGWLKRDFAQAVSREGYSKALCPCPLILEHERDGIKANFNGGGRVGCVGRGKDDPFSVKKRQTLANQAKSRNVAHRFAPESSAQEYYNSFKAFNVERTFRFLLSFF